MRTAGVGEQSLVADGDAIALPFAPGTGTTNRVIPLGNTAQVFATGSDSITWGDSTGNSSVTTALNVALDFTYYSGVWTVVTSFPWVEVQNQTTPTYGHPLSGLWFKGQIYVDGADDAWVCTTTGTPGTWATVAPDVSGRLLVFDQYAPASTTSISLTTTLAALDTTHLSMSFVAPPSGNVLVEVEAETSTTTATGGADISIFLGLFLFGTTTLQAGLARTMATQNSAGVITSIRTTSTFYVSGLVPTNAVTFSVAGGYSQSTSGQSAGLVAGSTTTLTGAGPINMKVFAA